MVLSVCPMAMAVSYNDSTITNSSDQWQSWVSQWENVPLTIPKCPSPPAPTPFCWMRLFSSLSHRLGNPDTVYSGRSDAAGVPGSLSAGIESSDD